MVSQDNKYKLLSTGENTSYQHGKGHILGISPVLLGRSTTSESVEMTPGYFGASQSPTTTPVMCKFRSPAKAGVPELGAPAPGAPDVAGAGAVAPPAVPVAAPPTGAVVNVPEACQVPSIFTCLPT